MDNSDWQKIIRGLALLTQIGIIMIINIGVGFFLGYLLDDFLGTTLVFKIGGLLVGIASGFYSNYKIINNFFEDDA